MTAGRFEAAAGLLTSAVADGAFPGAAFGVLHRGRVVGLEAVGRFTYEAESAAVTGGTSFDLASVTKVLATTAMAMLLWQKGLLDLDQPVGALVPEFAQGDAGRSAVTLRLLLAHASGLPGYAPLFESCGEAGALREAVLRMPLVAEPGRVTAYSDPGFMLLGWALEALAGERLEVFCGRKIFGPLGMGETRFCPERVERVGIPPTEQDIAFRGGMVQGVVHDENCFVLGGVAGHAGLFAPVADVLRFAEAMLGAVRRPDASPLFSAEAVRLFTTRVDVPGGSTRALGWDTRSGTVPSSGTRFGALSYGHLGYTGTSLWLDPDADCAIVLLTNRTFPSRDNRKIQEIRPLFHDAIREVLPG